MSISLFVHDEYEYESQQMQNFLWDLGNASVPIQFEYISKEIALDREIQRNSDLLDILWNENPLPDSIILQVTPENADSLLDIISRYSYLFLLQDDEEQQKYLEQVDTIKNFQRNFIALQILIYTVLFVFLGAVAFFCFLFIQNHAFLFLQEIRIAIRAGASFIRIIAPYILLVSLLLGIAFMLAIVGTYGAGSLWPFTSFGIPVLSWDLYTYHTFLRNTFWFFVGEIGVVILIGILSVLSSFSCIIISKSR